jgi:hypothetical protein
MSGEPSSEHKVARCTDATNKTSNLQYTLSLWAGFLFFLSTQQTLKSRKSWTSDMYMCVSPWYGRLLLLLRPGSTNGRTHTKYPQPHWIAPSYPCERREREKKKGKEKRKWTRWGIYVRVYIFPFPGYICVRSCGQRGYSRNNFHGICTSLDFLPSQRSCRVERTENGEMRKIFLSF